MAKKGRPRKVKADTKPETNISQEPQAAVVPTNVDVVIIAAKPVAVIKPETFLDVTVPEKEIDIPHSGYAETAIIPLKGVNGINLSEAVAELTVIKRVISSHEYPGKTRIIADCGVMGQLLFDYFGKGNWDCAAKPHVLRAIAQMEG